MEICFRLAQNPYAVCTVVSLNLKCTPASRCMQNPNGKPMPAWWQSTLPQFAPYAGTAVNRHRHGRPEDYAIWLRCLGSEEGSARNYKGISCWCQGDSRAMHQSLWGVRIHC